MPVILHQLLKTKERFSNVLFFIRMFLFLLCLYHWVEPLMLLFQWLSCIILIKPDEWCFVCFNCEIVEIILHKCQRKQCPPENNKFIIVTWSMTILICLYVLHEQVCLFPMDFVCCQSKHECVCGFCLFAFTACLLPLTVITWDQFPASAIENSNNQNIKTMINSK